MLVAQHSLRSLRVNSTCILLPGFPLWPSLLGSPLQLLLCSNIQEPHALCWSSKASGAMPVHVAHVHMQARHMCLHMWRSTLCARRA
jgi:hypothetical protein